MGEYDDVVRRVNGGSSLAVALEDKELSRSHFFRKRCIAEASKVDMPALQNAILQLRKVTLPNLYPAAKDICNRNLGTLRRLHADGKAFNPKDRY